MASSGSVVRLDRGGARVQECAVECVRLVAEPTGGWRAVLAVTLDVELPDGRRFSVKATKARVPVYSSGKFVRAAAGNGRKKVAKKARRAAAV